MNEGWFFIIVLVIILVMVLSSLIDWKLVATLILNLFIREKTSGGEAETPYVIDPSVPLDPYRVDKPAFVKKKIDLLNSYKVIVDGFNLIHAMARVYRLNDEQFKNSIDILSKCLTDALPDKDIHVVIKNLKLQSSNKEELLKEKFITNLIDLSNKYYVTYHVASTNRSISGEEHVLKGRDDFLVIYLASYDGYIISNDKFKDFGKLHLVPAFNHIEIKGGEIKKIESIEPKSFFNMMGKPFIGNHLYHKFTTHDIAKERGIVNGDVLIDENNDINIFFVPTV